MSDEMDIQFKSLIVAIIILFLVVGILLVAARKASKEKTDEALLKEQNQDSRITTLESKTTQVVEVIEKVPVIDDAAITASIQAKIEANLRDDLPTSYCLRSHEPNGIVMYRCG